MSHGFAASTISYPPNLLINGGGDFFQRNGRISDYATLTSFADDKYGADRWNILTQTASVQTAQVTGPTSPYSQYAIRLKQNQSSAQRMGMEQIIESADSIKMRGLPCRFEFQVNISNSQAVRYAILEWTGSADAPTSDVVNDWTSSTYTASNFFLGSNLTVTAVGSTTPSAATWTKITLDATIGTSCNNLIVFVWTEGTAAQNVTMDLGQLQFHRGWLSVPWDVSAKPLADTLDQCQRYYCQFQNSFGGDRNHFIGCIADSATTANLMIYFPTEMRTLPTFARTSESISGWHMVGVGAFDQSMTAVSMTASGSSMRAKINITVGSGMTAGVGYFLYSPTGACGFTFDAEL